MLLLQLLLLLMVGTAAYQHSTFTFNIYLNLNFLHYVITVLRLYDKYFTLKVIKKSTPNKICLNFIMILIYSSI